MSTIYECTNSACTLGSRKDPGQFTGGMTAAQKNLLTGDPVESLEEGKDFGEGVCPVCGEKGKATKNSHVVVEKGGDPYQDLHDRIAERVADASDPLTAEEAQNTLTSQVEAVTSSATTNSGSGGDEK